MSVFGGLVLTNNGRNLYVKAQMGKMLKLKRIALGDGELGTSESMLTLTGLKNEVLSCNIAKLQIVDDSTVKVTFTMKNPEQGFYWRELGVIAEDVDTGSEVLYVYGNARENSEYIAPIGGADVLEKRVNIDLIVSNVENISAVINDSLIFATKEDIDEINAEIEDLKKLIENAYKNVQVNPEITENTNIWISTE